uniref:Uncharacterized protein n=1 Tax=Anopheles farauti TaxID=69004 RepID=A0A182QS60_9DIPT
MRVSTVRRLLLRRRNSWASTCGSSVRSVDSGGFGLGGTIVLCARRFKAATTKHRVGANGGSDNDEEEADGDDAGNDTYIERPKLSGRRRRHNSCSAKIIAISRQPKHFTAFIMALD